MPGLITHNRVFFEAINLLKKKDQNSIHNKSIEALFLTKTFLKAGLFGTIGPDIFNFFPFFKKNYSGCSQISFDLHSVKSSEFLNKIFALLSDHKYKNNEWYDILRAYFYGLISHYIADSIFHPFIYYWSGFPLTRTKKELLYFREQHILFENNIDMFFLLNNDIAYNKKFEFISEDMLPIDDNGKSRSFEPSIIALLSDSIKTLNPELHKRFKFLMNKNDSNVIINEVFKLTPFLFRLSYKMKKSRGRGFIRFLDYLRKKNLIWFNSLIYYSPVAKINTHVLNLHKERWFHPAGTSGLHYESINDLLLLSGKQTISLWQKIEDVLYLHPEKLQQIAGEFRFDAYTGLREKDFNSMHLQKPNRLHLV